MLTDIQCSCTVKHGNWYKEGRGILIDLLKRLIRKEWRVPPLAGISYLRHTYLSSLKFPEL